jgi:hypothetical protein
MFIGEAAAIVLLAWTTSLTATLLAVPTQASGAACERRSPLEKLPQHARHERVIFGLRQAEHGDAAHHADVAHDDRGRATVRRLSVRIEP